MSDPLPLWLFVNYNVLAKKKNGLPTFQAEIPKDSYCILLIPANNSSVPLNSSIQSLELKER